MQTRLAGLCFLLSLLVTVPLRAAEPAAETPAQDESAAEQTGTTEADTAAIEAEDPALAEEIRAAEAAAANAPPADPNEPFIPSVQISEDLSVSFPVDI